MPTLLVFDSGLGGLTVLAEIDRLRPEAERLYLADDAVFPYGSLNEADLVARVVAVMEPLVARHRPDAVVVACNTASTAVLPPLRARWPDLAVIGTVPAIKPAAAASLIARVSASCPCARRAATSGNPAAIAPRRSGSVTPSAASSKACADRSGRL